MKNILLVPFLLLIIGCSSKMSIDGIIPIEATVSGDQYMGTGTPWNGVFVTANHVDLPSEMEVIHVCSTGCDLKFFKVIGDLHAARDKAPAWREATNLEPVQATGFILQKDGLSQEKASRRISTSGFDYGKPIKLSNLKQMVHRGVTTKTREGMSGGPVTGDDGKILGIQIGKTRIRGENEENVELAIYIPTSEINKEWLIYKASKQ